MCLVSMKTLLNCLWLDRSVMEAVLLSFSAVESLFVFVGELRNRALLRTTFLSIHQSMQMPGDGPEVTLL